MAWKSMKTAPKDKCFLAYLEDGDIIKARYLEDEFCASDIWALEPTSIKPLYWMPLPLPPKGK